MIAAPASTRAMVWGRATALEGARIGVSPVSVSGSGAGSFVLTIRRTGSGQIDDVDRILPANYLLLPRSGPPPVGPGACAPPPVRGDVMRRLRCIIAALLAVLWTAPLSAQQPTG